MRQNLNRLLQSEAQNVTTGEVAEDEGRLDDAESSYRLALADCHAALKIAQQSLQRARARCADTLVRLATVLDKQGRTEDARALYDELASLRRMVALEMDQAGTRQRPSGDASSRPQSDDDPPRQWSAWPPDAWPPRL